MRAHALAPRPPVGIVSMSASVDRGDVQSLCDQVRARLSGGASVVVCDMRAVASPDVGIIEALARMQLTARRHGGEVRLRAASWQVLELLRLIGLTKVMPVHPGSFVGPGRRPVGCKPRW